MAQSARLAIQATAALAAVRAYRRTPPEPPYTPRRTPDAMRAQPARAPFRVSFN